MSCLKPTCWLDVTGCIFAAHMADFQYMVRMVAGFCSAWQLVKFHKDKQCGGADRTHRIPNIDPPEVDEICKLCSPQIYSPTTAPHGTTEAPVPNKALFSSLIPLANPLDWPDRTLSLGPWLISFWPFSSFDTSTYNCCWLLVHTSLHIIATGRHSRCYCQA